MVVLPNINTLRTVFEKLAFSEKYHSNWSRKPIILITLKMTKLSNNDNLMTSVLYFSELIIFSSMITWMRKFKLR